MGISADTVKSHKKFAAKYDLPFTLLSDQNLEVIKSYGSFGNKKLFGREFEGIIRKTFIINPEGEIVKEYSKVTPEIHAAQILQDLADLT